MDKNQITKQQCLTKSRELQANYRWQLMTAEALSEAAMESIENDPTIDLQPAIISTYAGQALYPALLGQQGTAQREQAARELADFLHRVLYKRWPSLAESPSDLIQATLERTFRQIDSCRSPETVLAFAAMKLRTVVQKEVRQLSREQKSDSIDAMHEQGQEVPSPEESESGLSMDALRDQIRRFQQAHPKAAKQFETVYLRYCDGLTVEETAERLGMTRQNVSVLTSRGLKFLRDRKDALIF